MAEAMLNNMKIMREDDFFSKNNLINCLMYRLSTNENFFILIGVESNETFNTAVRIISPLQNVSITVDTLKCIYNSMGNILSMILSDPIKKEHVLLLEDDSTSISKSVYREKNVLLIKSRSQPRCQVILKYEHLTTLLNLECMIMDAINRQNIMNKPVIQMQYDEITEYYHNICTKDNVLYDYNTIDTTINKTNYHQAARFITEKHGYSYAYEILALMHRNIVERLNEKRINNIQEVTNN
ncbi:uncharacterized protein LOC126909211 [Daktulosphaira vitifoliae]|uniref:uncharacterized protein LOC126909211 n=1 Tax=Daktulosphaira vitifoliae TaxID=58002 RepID=UPI0021AA4E5B|nr:uncharacterized protein LOC126909211 [Daktulosphaira vitifoliae]